MSTPNELPRQVPCQRRFAGTRITQDDPTRRVLFCAAQLHELLQRDTLADCTAIPVFARRAAIPVFARYAALTIRDPQIYEYLMELEWRLAREQAVKHELAVQGDLLTFERMDKLRIAWP